MLGHADGTWRSSTRAINLNTHLHVADRGAVGTDRLCGFGQLVQAGLSVVFRLLVSCLVY